MRGPSLLAADGQRRKRVSAHDRDILRRRVKRRILAHHLASSFGHHHRRLKPGFNQVTNTQFVVTGNRAIRKDGTLLWDVSGTLADGDNNSAGAGSIACPGVK